MSDNQMITKYKAACISISPPSSWIATLNHCSVLFFRLWRLHGFFRGVCLYAVRQVSLTISATQSSEVMKHSVLRMWQEIHICLLCFTLLQRCSSVCSSEVLGLQNIQEQLCLSAEQGNRIGIDSFFIVIKRLQWNIKPDKPCIPMDADSKTSLPESIINTAIKYSTVQ